MENSETGYSLCLVENRLLRYKLIVATPAKKTKKDQKLLLEILAAWNKINPITRLVKAQYILVDGKESPCPEGLAKGVGNLLPQIPCTKCGTKLARNIPAQNALR